MKIDQWARKKRVCIDDQAHCWLIEGAQKVIFNVGQSVVSQAVENMIGAKSLMPMHVSTTCTDQLQPTDFIIVQNAFSDTLGRLGFNFYSIFVPDFMHEFELGVQKATIMHLIHILFELGDNTIQELNARYVLNFI